MCRDASDRVLRDLGVFTSRTARSLGFSERQVLYRLAHHRWYRVVGHALSVDPPPPSGWSAVTLARAASITRPGRTALDCLAVLPPSEADDLHAWLATRGYLSPQALEAGIRDRRRRPGTGKLRDLQRRSASGALSEAERRVHRMFREAGVNGWEANVRLEDADGIIGVVDILFREERVVVEIDGRRAHDTEDSFVRDRRRQNRLVNAGYRVLRFTWADIVSRPAGILREIRAALARPGPGSVG